jgi:hypothetical protein
VIRNSHGSTSTRSEEITVAVPLVERIPLANRGQDLRGHIGSGISLHLKSTEKGWAVTFRALTTGMTVLGVLEALAAPAVSAPPPQVRPGVFGFPLPLEPAEGGIEAITAPRLKPAGYSVCR